MDDAYIPTFEEWSSMQDNVRWLWLADDMLLHFNYMRAPRSPGIPLADKLEIEIETAASITGASHPNEHTRQEFLATLDNQLAERTEKERMALEAGLPIDLDYQNPTISGLHFPETPPSDPSAKLPRQSPTG